MVASFLAMTLRMSLRGTKQSHFVYRLFIDLLQDFKTKISNPHKFALGIGAVSPDLEKQGFLVVVFVNWEYSG